MKLSGSLLLVPWLMVALHPCLAQTIRYVKADGTGNGSSWQQASANIQAMIDASATGDQLWIAGGLYKNTGLFYVEKGIAMYGGFAGQETALNERKLSSPSTSTLISGAAITSGVLGTQGQVFIQIDGFCIKGGRSSNGAGLQNYASNCQVVNCFFEDNIASGNGGAIWNYRGLTALNCVFKSNRTVQMYGGAIYNDSSLRVVNCSFTDNSAGGNVGGAISTASTAVITNSIFWHNGAKSPIESGRSYSDPYIIASYNLLEANVDNTGSNYSSNTDVRSISTPFADDQLRLRSSSLAIDAGNPASTTQTSGSIDIAGQPRFYQNGRIDIGAYEFQGSKTAGVVYSLRAGNWNDATIWSTGQQPTKEDAVQVRHLINIVNGFVAYGFSVSYEQGGEVTIEPSGKLNIGL